MTANEIKKDKLGGTSGTHRRTEKFVYCLVEIRGTKGLLGRPERRWEEIICAFSPYNANVENMVSS